MYLEFLKIRMRNIFSVGNVVQEVDLTSKGLTLILGRNVDQGGDEFRNGTGKSTLLQAISLALYGQPLTKVKKENLVNKTNQKNLEVAIDFTCNGNFYTIERGIKPNYLIFKVNNELFNDSETNEAHGENKHTQKEIEKLIGMSHTLFKHLVALNTKTMHFLSMGPTPQREIIEELFGIDMLSQKSELLKDLIKTTKEEIRSEEVRINTLNDSNNRIQRSIENLKIKFDSWKSNHLSTISDIENSIILLENINVDEEIENQRKLVDWKKIKQTLSSSEKTISRLTNEKLKTENDINKLEEQLVLLKNHSCPMCGNEVCDKENDTIKNEIQTVLDDLKLFLSSIVNDLQAARESYDISFNELSLIGKNRPEVFYDDLEDALEHKHKLDILKSELSREKNTENPYKEQIDNLKKDGLQKIEYGYLNELTLLKEHQDFLYKLLTSKDSFIRKKIIDQNLFFLNIRLNHYTEELKLPHEVVFESDLSVTITKYGKEYDYEQLSNGEMNRLVLALSWSFRDVWESGNHPLNFIAIDEMVDSGMDIAGTDASINLLKNLSREKNKNVFLISHKDGLEPRVDNILMVTKENDFTTYSSIES